MSENPYQKLQVLESETNPLNRQDRLKAITGPLLFWYREHARDLPWRREPTPYAVWISEIMRQQTRVEAVRPYFIRFMDALPDVRALSLVPDDRLLKLWEGLGYYNRARNLKRTAQIVVNEYGGCLPDTKEELQKLPGIGSYTAGAVASIAYGKPEPAVDGNVLRVILRLTARLSDVKWKRTWRRLCQRRTAAPLIRACSRSARPSVYRTARRTVQNVRCVPFVWQRETV